MVRGSSKELQQPNIPSPLKGRRQQHHCNGMFHTTKGRPRPAQGLVGDILSTWRWLAVQSIIYAQNAKRWPMPFRMFIVKGKQHENGYPFLSVLSTSTRDRGTQPSTHPPTHIHPSNLQVKINHSTVSCHSLFQPIVRFPETFSERLVVTLIDTNPSAGRAVGQLEHFPSGLENMSKFNKKD